MAAQRGGEFGVREALADGLEVQAHAADAEGVPLLEKSGGGVFGGVRVEGDDGAGAGGTEGAQGLEEAGVVGAVDGGLDEDELLEADRGLEGEGLLRGEERGPVDGVAGEREAARVDDVDVAVAGAPGNELEVVEGLRGRKRGLW